MTGRAASRTWPARALAALAVGGAVGILATLPPRPRPAPPPGPRVARAGAVVRGAYHVHSLRSDGTGTLEEIARAAAAAGLDFVICTDHGDGTRGPEPPVYRAGVLALDAVEVSTRGGHYVAMGLPRAPYPLGGEARDVVEDARRLGGLGIAAHPDSAKASLRWADWSLPVDGFEWLSADSEWRDEPVHALALAALHVAWRGPAALATLFDRPATTLARWDRLAAGGRRLVALGALDAHARLGTRGPGGDVEEGIEGGSLALAIPTYAQIFRTFSTHVELDAPLSGDAVADARRLLDALRSGRAFTVVDAVATPGAFEFFAETPRGRARMGDEVDPAVGPVEFHARAAAPAGSRIVLLRNGDVVAQTTGVELTHRADTPAPGTFASYRVEVFADGAPGVPPLPWIVSNAILVGRRADAPAAPSEAPGSTLGLVQALYAQDPTADAWRTEHDRGSRARLEVGGADGRRALAFHFALAARARPCWAAAVRHLAVPIAGGERLRFRAWSSRPLRLSVQLRVQDPHSDRRWQRSVYLDAVARDVSLTLDDFVAVTRRPAGPTGVGAGAVLFVVDLTHAAGGASGTVWLQDVRLER